MLEIILTKSPLKQKTGRLVKKIVVLASRYEKKIDGSVEVAIVGDKRIRTLNRKYRGKDKITDVLSFSWRPGNFLGQIFICYPRIIRQAKEFGVSVEEEFGRMLIHGLLHLVGYDHVKKNEAKKMFALQEKIVKKSLS